MRKPKHFILLFFISLPPLLILLCQSYPQAHVFMICYSVSNLESFAHIMSKWIPELNQHCPKPPRIVVGLKEDTALDIEARLVDVAVADAVCIYRKPIAVRFLFFSFLVIDAG